MSDPDPSFSAPLDPLTPPAVGSSAQAARPKGSQWSRMRPVTRVLVVLALLFGFLMVAGGLGLVGGAWWFFRQGPQVSTTAVVGPDSTGVVRLDLDLDDPAVGGFVEAMFTAAMESNQRQQDAQLPPLLRGLRQNQAGQAMFWIRRMMPREATLSFAPRGQASAAAAAVNLYGFGGALKLLLRMVASDSGTTERIHRGHRVLEDGDFAIGLVGTTLLVGPDLGRITTVIDRIEDGDALAEIPPRLGALGKRVAEHPELFAHIGNDTGDVVRVVGPYLGADADALAGVSTLIATVDLISADSVELAAFADCADEESALALAGALQRAEPVLVAWTRLHHLGLQFNVIKHAAEVKVHLRLSGLRAAAEAELDAAAAARYAPSM